MVNTCYVLDMYPATLPQGVEGSQRIPMSGQSFVSKIVVETLLHLEYRPSLYDLCV